MVRRAFRSATPERESRPRSRVASSRSSVRLRVLGVGRAPASAYRWRRSSSNSTVAGFGSRASSARGARSRSPFRRGSHVRLMCAARRMPRSRRVGPRCRSGCSCTSRLHTIGTKDEDADARDDDRGQSRFQALDAASPVAAAFLLPQAEALLGSSPADASRGQGVPAAAPFDVGERDSISCGALLLRRTGCRPARTARPPTVGPARSRGPQQSRR